MYLGLSILLSVSILLTVGLYIGNYNISFWIFNTVGINVEGGIYIDKLSVYFLFMLGVCSFLVFMYCFHYFGLSYEGNMLFYLILWFVGVMCCLVISNSLIVSLLFWDYLGFVSYLLILFYGSFGSFRSSVITMLSSRIGDVAFYCLVVLMFFESDLNKGWIFLVAFPLIVLSKSACYPFTSWLLEAMRAPTPVSALVHSSTLVAAGVWFFSRYSGLLGESQESVYSVVVVLSLISVFISGFCSLFYSDLKKIVALSTCNNISWCLVFIVLGDVELALYQLISHGICKCLLFILVGDIMSSSNSSQSYLMVYSGSLGYLGSYILVFSLILGLSGLPFLGIYFTKHLFFSGVVISCINWFLCGVILLGFLLSCAYSFRLCLMIFVGGVNVLGCISSFKIIMYICCMYSLVNCVFSYGCSELGVLNSLGSFLLLVFQVLGLLLGGFVFFGVSLNKLSSSFWVNSLFGSDWVVNLIFSNSIISCLLFPLGMFQWEPRLGSVLSGVFGGFGKNGLYYMSGSMSIGFLFVMCLVWFIVLGCV